MTKSISKQSFLNQKNTYACIVFAFVLIALANLVECQFPEKLLQNPCVSKTTCRDCIQTKSCAWCLQPNFGDKPRCFQPSQSSLTGGCPEEYTWNPDHEEVLTSKVELTRAGGLIGQSAATQSIAGGSYQSSSSRENYSSKNIYSENYNRQRESSSNFKSRGSSQNTAYGSYSESGKIVQIYPQRVALKLRISM